MAKTRIERILEPFGARHGADLIDFFNKISDAEFDAVVFMARKSLCIYRMMLLCGIRPIKAEVYSDAILDGGGSYLKGKKVLVVDDTLFVGTTLFEARIRLAKLGTKLTEFWVYCVDKETWQAKTFQPDYIHVEATTQNAIEFCAAECRALINAGIPYLTDFPASKRIRLYPKELDAAIKPINWRFFDVSSQYHDKCKVKYYSAIPDQFVNDRIEKVIGAQIFSLIEIAKVRVFATWTGRFYEVTFVPVVTFGAIKAADLQKSCHALCQVFGIDLDLLENSTIKDYARLLQFLVGSVFLRNYWLHLASIKDTSLSDRFDFSWCSAIFPSDLADSISHGIAALHSDSPLDKLPNLPPLRIEEPQSIFDETTNDISQFLKDYFSGSDEVDFRDTPLSDLTAIFLEFHRRFENPARKEIRDNVEIPRYRDRLKRGMAWSALCAYLLNKYKVVNTRYKRNILSLVLDRMVDFGIAVPILAVSESHVYRAYRHGEDIRFGAQEENLVYSLLEGFEKGRGTDGIEGTYLEKLIVILLRVGMSEEWLNLWYSNSGTDTLVRVGFYLQGAVPIIPRRDDELIPEGKESWLSERLCKTGTIVCTRNDQGKMYSLGQQPEAAHARRDAGRNALILGHTIGKACISSSNVRSIDRPMSSEDLIVLTSCANLLDVVAAASAELKIFADWYGSDGKTILLGGLRSERGFKQSVSVKGSRGEQAVNSGLWKIKRFSNRALDEIKDKVYALEEQDTDWITRVSFWDAVFQVFERKAQKADDAKLRKILRSFDDLLVSALMVLALIELLRLDRTGMLSPSSSRRLREHLAAHGHIDFLNTGSQNRLLGNLLSNEKSKSVLSRMENGQLSKELDQWTQKTIALALQEVDLSSRVIVRADRKLSRTIYNFVLWYDILDVRVRKTKTPDDTDRYASALDQFRAQVNSLLADTTQRVQLAGGNVFVETGEVRSFNDEKHTFFSGKGSMEEEGYTLACAIMRVANKTGVKVRLVGVPTNLRGEHVYLNRGTTSIDGDFKSHLHTLIQELKKDDLEDQLQEGDSILWLLEQRASQFKSQGSLNIQRMPSDREIQVGIRGFPISNTLTPFICRSN